jgi:hypothetical protein
MKALKVLVACEESQAVTKAFRALGHEAYSCDIQPCSGGHPEWHIQKDVTSILYDSNLRIDPRTDGYDLVISFPPCTDLAVSGARWFDKKRLSGEQEASIEFFFHVYFYSHCTENPIGIMGGGDYIKKWFPNIYKKLVENKFPFKPTQIIHPWQFGHGETKSTCLWLQGLPPLIHTSIVSGREQRIWKLPPTEDRATLRSKTYAGIADAMATQWSEYLTHKTENK